MNHPPHRTYFNWSSGKDASLALYHLQQSGGHDVQRLVTTINAHHDRVSMHGLRRSMLEAQARAIGIPLQTIELPEMPTMADYDRIMAKEIGLLRDAGFTHCGYGDIFLEDLKHYRDQQLQPLGITPVYPLWKRDTTELIHEFLDLGFRAVVVCCSGNLLGESFLGREINADFLRDLPHNVDPCGENGEFHTFCFDGPIFNQPVQFELGERVYREYDAPSGNGEKVGFWFGDLVATMN